MAAPPPPPGFMLEEKKAPPRKANVGGKKPAPRSEPGWITRQLGSLNEGIADTLGAPVDLVNMGLNALGVPVSQKPVAGSEWFRSGLHAIGIGQTDEGFAPKSKGERYTQALARGVGQAAIPAGASIGAGAKLANRAPSLITKASPVRQAARSTLVEAAKRPGVAIAGEVGGGVGASVAGTAADDLAPGNPYVKMAATVAGGLGGGFAGAAAAARRAPFDEPPSGFVLEADSSPVGTQRDDLAGLVPESPVAIPEGPVATPDALPRVIDRIDVAPPPPGFVLEDLPNVAKPMRAGADDLAAVARSVMPEDVQPIPSNVIESSEEAASLAAGVRPLVESPDPAKQLTTRHFPSTRDASRTLPRRGPVDLVGWLRTQGGLRDDGGELRHMGIDNKARNIDMAQAESRLGKLVDPENGMSLDDAAYAAWAEGYMPNFSERPTVREFLEVLGDTHGGSNRAFHPDDLAEVEAFDKAQEQARLVGKYEQDGAPLIWERGRPATQADIEANAAPVTAYEDLPRVGGKVANINLAHVETRGDIRRVLQTTETKAGGFDAARRGKISQGETEALARELGMSVQDLLKRRPGQALNAEQALAARQLLAKSSDELVSLAGRVKGGSDEQLAAFRQAWLRHAAIQEQVTGATAEAGRALAQFKMAAKSKAVGGRLHQAVIEGSGGRDRLEDAAQAIIDLQRSGVGPGEVNRFAVLALKPKFSDKMVELWYNSILSGPQTHAVNMLSNAMTSALQLPEMATAAALGTFRRSSVDRVLGSELGPRVVGLLQGTREGLRAFGRTLKTGEVPDHVTKVEARTQKAISGIKGEVIRTPSRLLAAEDELFKAIARRMELAGLAVRKAKGEGLNGEELQRRIVDLNANPSEDMIERSLDYARYLTYQRPLGEVGQAVSRATQAVPLLKLFIPFVRTPANIMKFVVERSPAAPVLKEWRADIKAGGARRDLAAARMALGTGFGMMVMEWAQAGHVSGSGPLDDGAKAIMRADGWQPYSIKVGDTWYSYQRLDPLATTLGVASDFALRSQYMTDKQQEEGAALIVASIMGNLADKTWLTGMSDLLAALSDPQRYGPALVNRLVGSLAVPAIMAQTARTIDPVIRKTDTPVEAILSRVPGKSQLLMPRRDIWGEAVTRPDALGPDILSPIGGSPVENDPLNREMLAIGARFGTPANRDQ